MDKYAPPCYTEKNLMERSERIVTMKARKNMLLVTATAAVFALGLRLWQQLTGFEEVSHLALPGHPAAIAVEAVLLVAAVVLTVIARALPGAKEERGFEEMFSTQSVGEVTLIVLGVFLMLSSGVLQILFALLGGGLQNVLQSDGMAVTVVWMGTVSPKEVLLLGGTALVSAICLLPTAAVCRCHEDRPGRNVNGTVLLVPILLLVVRLVLVYRIDSIDPVLQSYYVELLALVFVILAFYQLAGFAFGQGSHRWYSVCSGMAVVLCAATLADGHDISDTLFYAGSGLSVLGFWLVYRRSDPR